MSIDFLSKGIMRAELDPNVIRDSIASLAEEYRGFFFANEKFLPLLPPEIFSFKIGTPARMEKDNKWVTKVRKEFLARKSEIGITLERMLQGEIFRSGWFGGAKFFRTTEYDDFHGADGVLEWPMSDGKVIRLAIDATGNADTTRILEKLERQKGPKEVRYFRSSFSKNKDGRPVEETIYPPLVVLGINERYLPKILNQLKKRKNLKGYWSELVFVMEAIRQLRQMRERLEEINPDFCEIVDAVYQKLDAFLESKKREPAYTQLSTLPETPFLSPLLVPEIPKPEVSLS